MNVLSQHSVLTVSQQAEPLQIVTGLETENRYRIVDESGEPILFAYVESGFMSRQFLGGRRPMKINVIDGDGQLQMAASRRYFWFFSHLDLQSADGSPIGRMQRQFGFLARRFSLTDAHGGTAQVHGPRFRPHTFWVRRAGQEVATITKVWGGIARELVTVADHFKIEFAGLGVEENLRWLVIGAALAIDHDFFENRRRFPGGIRPGTLGGHSHDTGGFTGRGF